jgi:hypothetical protein
VHGRAVNLPSQAKPRLHRAIPRWGGVAHLFFGRDGWLSRPQIFDEWQRPAEASGPYRGFRRSPQKTPWYSLRFGRYFDSMKVLRILLLAGLSCVGCATVPRESDGIALECNVCRTMWVRIDQPGPITGDYRIEHERGRKVCPECEKIGRRFVRTGEAPAKCEVCGGTLITGVVELTDDAVRE